MALRRKNVCFRPKKICALPRAQKIVFKNEKISTR